MDNRMKLVERAIKKNPKIYKNPQIIYKLAGCLRVFDDNTQQRHSVITVRLAEEAFKDQDYLRCSEFCKDLIVYNDPTSWKVCLDLGECDQFPNTQVKILLLLFASIHAPSRHLPQIISKRTLFQVKNECINSQLLANENSNEVNFQFESNQIEINQESSEINIRNISQCYRKVQEIFQNPNVTYSYVFDYDYSKIDKNLTQTCYTFYCDCHQNCKVVDCYKLDQSIFANEEPVPITYILEQNKHLGNYVFLKEVAYGYSIKYVTEDTLLTLGYLLSLKEPEQSEQFFLNLPETPFVFQLAIFYYALCSSSYIRSCETFQPQEIVYWAHNEEGNSVKYLNLLKKHESRYAKYIEADQVLKLRCGVNSERYMTDQNYRMDSILGLAMNSDKLNLAFDLAAENDIPLAEVAVTHIISMLFEKQDDALADSLTNHKMMSVLSKDGDTIKSRLIAVLPNLDGFNHQTLVMFFTVLKTINGSSLVHNLTPSDHIELLLELSETLPDIDYKYLMENHEKLIIFLKENLHSEIFLKLVNILHGVISSGEKIEDSEIFLQFIIQQFKDMCLVNHTLSEATLQFEKLLLYLPELKENQILKFVEDTICSTESATFLNESFCLEALLMLLKWCNQSDIRDMNIAIEYIIKLIEKVKKKANIASEKLTPPTIEPMKHPKPDLNLINDDDFFTQGEEMLTPNDWNDEFIFDTKEMFSNEDSNLCETIYSFNDVDEKNTFEDAPQPDEASLSTFYSSLKQSNSACELYNLLLYLKSCKLSESDKEKATVSLLKTLIEINDIEKYDTYLKIANVLPISNEVLTQLANEQSYEDYLFFAWICTVSKFTIESSILDEQLSKVKVSHLENFFKKKLTPLDKDLLHSLLNCRKYMDLLSTISSEGKNFNMQSMANSIKSCNISAEAGSISMHFHRVPSSLKSFNSALLHKVV